MMLALRQQEGIRADDAAKIEIMPHSRRLPHTDNPSPQTPLQAKFSVQYGVARALLDGAVRIADFEGDAHFDPCIQALLARTTAFPHPDMADDADAQFSAEIRVTLNDGRILSRRVDDMAGRGGDHPMSSEEVMTFAIDRLDDQRRSSELLTQPENDDLQQIAAGRRSMSNQGAGSGSLTEGLPFYRPQIDRSRRKIMARCPGGTCDQIGSVPRPQFDSRCETQPANPNWRGSKA
jgi:2-methylcitrate dehydratase PrpD